MRNSHGTGIESGGDADAAIEYDGKAVSAQWKPNI